jgi:hypothetical protein
MWYPVQMETNENMLQERFNQIQPFLNERQIRLLAAAEANARIQG